MKGGEGTAQMFGEVFRNIFGWNVTRPSALDEHIYDDLYSMYITDDNHLGIHDYFKQTNPAAYQAMTSVMLESARKGYWKPTEEQLKTTAELHAQITEESGAACTEFVCGNDKLQAYIAQQLDDATQQRYESHMREVKEAGGSQRQQVLREQRLNTLSQQGFLSTGALAGVVALLVVVLVIIMIRRRRR